jgi:hypothetical protein
MTAKLLLVCVDPVGSHWQLGPLPPAKGRILLIGWRLTPRPVDDGVPDDVGAILTRAFTSIARVSFPVSEMTGAASKEWSDGDVQLRSLGDGGLIEHIKSALNRAPTSTTLLSTRAAQAAARMFDGGGYPWHLQGQAAVLSLRDAAPPDIDRQSLLSLIADDWAQQLVQLRCAGIVGGLRPGVDGEVVGVLSLNDGLTGALPDALEHEARRAGFGWLRLSEPDFTDMLAAAPPAEKGER